MTKPTQLVTFKSDYGTDVYAREKRLRVVWTMFAGHGSIY